MLPCPQIRKRFLEVFGNHDPSEAIILSAGDRATLLSNLCDNERVFSVQWNDYTGIQTWVDPVETTIPALLQSPTSGARKETFYLYYDLEGRAGLWVSLVRDPIENGSLKQEYLGQDYLTPVGVLKDVYRFVESIKDLQSRSQSRLLKKMRRASDGQSLLVEELRQQFEREFELRIGHNASDVLLSVRAVGRKTGSHFRFQLGRMDAVKQHAKAVVDSLEVFHELGIRFRTNNNRWTKQQCDWIDPD